MKEQHRIKQDVREAYTHFFSRARIRSINSVRMNKTNFATVKSCNVHMTGFEIFGHRNVDNWIQLLT